MATPVSTSLATLTRSGTVHVARPAGHTLSLFTPEGERSWIAGWAPSYPGGGVPQPAPGVVFQTTNHGDTTTWLVTRYDENERRATYAYVLPGQRATLVDVRVHELTAESSRVEVTYHMTALSSEGEAAVREFGERYKDVMAAWTDALAGAEF